LQRQSTSANYSGRIFLPSLFYTSFISLSSSFHIKFIDKWSSSLTRFVRVNVFHQGMVVVALNILKQQTDPITKIKFD